MRTNFLGLLAMGLLAAVSATASAATVSYGSGDTTAAADAAFAVWSSNVSGAVTDQLNGLAGTQGTNAVLTSSLGNRFGTSDDVANIGNFNIGVVQGTHFSLSRSGGQALFLWDLITPSNAFGFFALDIDGGTISVRFTDGVTTTYNVSGAGANVFWGIYGLNSLVSQVAVQTSDPGGVSYWDRFSYGTTQVPEPGTLALLGLGLAGLGLSRRRKAN